MMTSNDLIKVASKVSDTDTRFTLSNRHLKAGESMAWWAFGSMHPSLKYQVETAKNLLTDLKLEVNSLLEDFKKIDKNNAEEFAESLDDEAGKKILDLESILEAHKLWTRKLEKTASYRLAIFGKKKPSTIKEEALSDEPSEIEAQFRFNKQFFSLVDRIKDDYDVLKEFPSQAKADKLLKDIDTALEMSAKILSKKQLPVDEPKKKSKPSTLPVVEDAQLTDEQIELLEPEEEYQLSEGQYQIFDEEQSAKPSLPQKEAEKPKEPQHRSRRQIPYKRKEKEVKNLPEMRSYFARLLRMKPESAQYRNHLKKLFSLMKDNFGDEADLDTVLTASSRISSMIGKNERVRQDVMSYMKTIWGIL